MPMPVPTKGQSKEDWDNRCMSNPVMKAEFPDQGQRYKVCSDIWRRKDRLRIKNNKLQYLHQCSAQLVCNETNKAEWDQTFATFKQWLNQEQKPAETILKLPRSTLIVGDGIYNNIWHPKEEAEKAFQSMDRQPYNMNHSRDVADEIGWMESPLYDPKTMKLSAIPVINLNTEKGRTALGHIQNRIMAGKHPETSVGFWATESTETITIDDEEQELTVVREWEFDHNALVTRGACSPQDGAGIGLNKSELEEKTLEQNQENQNQEPEKNEKFSPVKPTGETFSLEQFRKIVKDEIKANEKQREQAAIDMRNKETISALATAVANKDQENAEKLIAELQGTGSEVSSEQELQERVKTLEKSLSEYSQRTTRTRTGELEPQQLSAEDHKLLGDRTGNRLLKLNAAGQEWIVRADHTKECTDGPPAPIMRRG